MLRILAIAPFVAGLALGFEPPASKDKAPTTQPASAPSEPEGVDAIRREADALRPLFETRVATQFLKATRRLPHVEPRTVYGNRERAFLSKAAWEKLPKEVQAKYRAIRIDESRYYYTLYGSPLAYGRVLDLLGKRGVETLEGKKVLDFGYGNVGQLRLMASCGAEAVGVDVDTLLPALYCEPSDAGRVENAAGADGQIRMVSGRFPADDDVRKQVGDGYDLFTSKNTLKNGYIHPAEKVDPRLTIDLGVTDEQFVQGVRDILKPGGLAIIYNLCPAPAKEGEKYIPWADGRCPFPRAMWEANGFEVLVFDKDDSAFARRMGKALGWDKAPDGMDLEHDLFATYTIARRK